MSVKKIKKLFVVALKPEWSHLKQVYSFQRDDKVGSLYFIEDHPGVALLQVGNGVKNAGENFSEFLKHYSCEAILHFGSCGALDSELKVGDLFVWESSELSSKYLPSLLQFCDESQLPHRAGKLLTLDRVLKNRSEKESAAHKYSAQAVDMESSLIADICSKNGIDYLSVRGVFDTLDDDISSLGEPYTDRGDLLASKLAVNLVKSPRLILQVPGLQKRMGLVNRRLGEVVDWFINLNDDIF